MKMRFWEWGWEWYWKNIYLEKNIKYTAYIFNIGNIICWIICVYFTEDSTMRFTFFSINYQCEQNRNMTNLRMMK